MFHTHSKCESNVILLSVYYAMRQQYDVQMVFKVLEDINGDNDLQNFIRTRQRYAQCYTYILCVYTCMKCMQAENTPQSIEQHNPVATAASCGNCHLCPPVAYTWCVIATRPTYIRYTKTNASVMLLCSQSMCWYSQSTVHCSVQQ
jgi:hypothetical protein